MGSSGSAFRVGLFVLAFAVVFGLVYGFLKNSNIFSPTYTLDVLFEDAHGVDKQAHVELAGVQIGVVESVKLTPAQKADLTLRIKNEFLIPKGARFTITTPILGSQGVITVTPPVDASKHPGNTIAKGAADLRGTQQGDLTSSFSKANKLLSEFTVTAKKANDLLDSTTKLIGDKNIQHSLKQSLDNVNLASRNGAVLTQKLNATLDKDNQELLALLHQTSGTEARLARGGQVALNNVTDTTAQIRTLARQNTGKINAIVSDLKDSTASLSGLAAQANDLLKDGAITTNLKGTVANLKTATDKLNVISDNFVKLSSDQGLQGDLRATLKNVRQSTEQTTTLLERLNKLAGVKPKNAAVVVAPGLGSVTVVAPNAGTLKPAPPTENVPLYLPRVNLVQDIRAKHFRTDFDLIVPVTTKPGQPGVFGRLGLYGAADTNRVNAQYGQQFAVGSPLDLRVGLYASKLSVGADYGLGRRGTLSLDAYDPNNLHVNAHGVLMFNKSLGILVGAEDITKRTGAVIGLEFRR